MKNNSMEHVEKWIKWFESLTWKRKYVVPVVKLIVVVVTAIIIPIIYYFIPYNYVILSVFFSLIYIFCYMLILNSYFDNQYHYPFFYKIYNQNKRINEILESKVKDGQKDADNLYYIAIICYELERYIEAEGYFKELIKKYPEHEWSYIELARCYFQQKRFTLAEDMYKKAIEINPNNDAAKEELKLLPIQSI